MTRIAMKPILMTAVFVTFFCQVVRASAVNSTVYSWSNHILDIVMSSPPALMYIEDSQGNLDGADPTKGLDKFGRGTSIQDIPSSCVDQDNLVSDDVNGEFILNNVTAWTVDILDQPTASYVVNLLGISEGACDLQITGIYKAKKPPAIESTMYLLVSPGITKQVQVAFDPTAHALTTTPVLTSWTLLQDTQTACGLDEISPPVACAVLETLASEVKTAMEQKDSRAEEYELKLYLKVLNRLHSWGNSGSRTDWNDMKGCRECGPLLHDRGDKATVSVQDTAYAALKLDVDTLLAALSQRGPGRGRHHH